MFDSKKGVCNHPDSIGCGSKSSIYISYFTCRMLTSYKLCPSETDVIKGDPCSEGEFEEGTLFQYEDCSEFYNECVHSMVYNEM